MNSQDIRIIGKNLRVMKEAAEAGEGWVSIAAYNDLGIPFTKIIRASYVIKGMECFDGLDYNNQRNVIWMLRDAAMHKVAGVIDLKMFRTVYDSTKRPGIEALADLLLTQDADALEEMAQKLTNMMRKTKLTELLESLEPVEEAART